MKLEPILPVGHRMTSCLVRENGTCQVRKVRLPVYPDGRGPEVRAARMKKELSLRKAAWKLGLKAADLSAIEQGRLKPPSYDELIQDLLR